MRYKLSLAAVIVLALAWVSVGALSHDHKRRLMFPIDPEFRVDGRVIDASRITVIDKLTLHRYTFGPESPADAHIGDVWRGCVLTSLESATKELGGMEHWDCP